MSKPAGAAYGFFKGLNAFESDGHVASHDELGNALASGDDERLGAVVDENHLATAFCRLQPSANFSDTAFH